MTLPPDVVRELDKVAATSDYRTRSAAATYLLRKAFNQLPAKPARSSSVAWRAN